MIAVLRFGIPFIVFLYAIQGHGVRGFLSREFLAVLIGSLLVGCVIAYTAVFLVRLRRGHLDK